MHQRVIPKWRIIVVMLAVAMLVVGVGWAIVTGQTDQAPSSTVTLTVTDDEQRPLNGCYVSFTSDDVSGPTAPVAYLTNESGRTSRQLSDGTWLVSVDCLSQFNIQGPHEPETMTIDVTGQNRAITMPVTQCDRIDVCRFAREPNSGDLP